MIVGASIASLAISGLSLLLLTGTVSSEVMAILITGVPGMIGLMIIPLCILLASAWALKKKGRSPLWLVLYVPGIIPCVGAVLCLSSKNKRPGKPTFICP